MQLLEEDDKYMQPVILIKKYGNELLTNSSLMLIKGEVGSGKSRLAMNMMVGLLTGKEDLHLEYKMCPDDKYVLYISTEMSKYHLQRRLIKVLETVPEHRKKNLRFFDAVSTPVEKKMDELNEAIKQFPPYVIIIDQLADFVSNINDIEQANQVVSRFMNGIEKADCAIVGIVHQNEDSGISSKARGHLGSVFEQKVVSSIAISDTSKGFNIKSTKIREGKQLSIKAVFNESTEMLIEKVDSEVSLETLTYPILREDLIKAVCSMNDCGARTAATLIAKYLENKTLESFKESKLTKYNLLKHED